MKSIVRKSMFVGLWFMLLTFPIIGIKIDALTNNVHWRWYDVFLMGLVAFHLSMLWHWYMERKERLGTSDRAVPAFVLIFQNNRKLQIIGAIALLAILSILPWVTSSYQSNIMISALLYVVLGLGLNIVVGLSGQLVLGYAAFYAVGAYTYALMNQHFGITFWFALPLGGLMAVLFSLILGFPTLRLKGDYLAIVTLGFAEIVRITLENWSDITGGAAGVSQIPRPSLFGMQFDSFAAITYIYYLMLGITILTIIAVTRLKNSRIGLAMEAMREDEIACEAMGIDIIKVKLSAFALGAFWAGAAGVIFAAKTTFINPASFTFMESAMILAIVVLGGMGSVVGVILGAFVLILAPEYLRTFSEYRMLIFGAVMVLMMVFRPQGIVPASRREYSVPAADADAERARAEGDAA